MFEKWLASVMDLSRKFKEPSHDVTVLHPFKRSSKNRYIKKRMFFKTSTERKSTGHIKNPFVAPLFLSVINIMRIVIVFVSRRRLLPGWGRSSPGFGGAVVRAEDWPAAELHWPGGETPTHSSFLLPLIALRLKPVTVRQNPALSSSSSLRGHRPAGHVCTGSTENAI